MKQQLIGTSLGHWLLAARDRLELLQTAWSAPESVGMLANDQLASFQTTGLARPGETFVDVGAHIGSIIADVRRRSKPDRILAVEAIPSKAAALRRKFPDVDIFECAVGDVDGLQVPFYVDRQFSGCSSLGRPDASGFDQVSEIMVPMRKLDSLLHGIDVDIIKVDVEGAELGALRGARETIARCRPLIMFESAPGAGARLGHTIEALWSLFAEAGYRVIAPNRLAHLCDGMSLDAFVDSHAYPRRTTNYFGVASERRAEFRQRARDLMG